jgi:hypothetical protein
MRRGAWGLLPVQEDANFADTPLTVYMLRALTAVRSAGRPVPRALIAAGEQYLEKAVVPLAYATCCSPLAQKWLRGYKRSAPDGGGLLLEYYRLCWAQVAYALGEEGFAKLFPDSRAEDRITWSGLRAREFRRLLQAQNADGSWPEGFDQIANTAVNLMILQLENGALPIHQR